MTDCVFCAILRGEAPGSLSYADDEVVGLLDINPGSPSRGRGAERRYTPKAQRVAATNSSSHIA